MRVPSCLRIFLFYQAVVLVGAVLISLLSGGFADLSFFGTNYVLAAFGMLAFAVFAVAGVYANTRSFTYQHASSASQSGVERIKDNMRDTEEAFGFFLNVFIAFLGALAIGLGITMLGTL